MQFPRPKLSYANVIATIALFVALGGAAVAAGLPKNSVGANQLKRNAVTTAKLKRNAVTSGKIAPKAVTAGKLGANAVLPGNLGNGIITTAKLSDSAVIASKIKNSVVTTNKLNNGAVTTAKLGDDSVNSGKLADGSVSVNKLGKGVVGQLQGKLESGTTIRGTFDLGSETRVDREGVSFQFPLLNPPAAPESNVVAASASTATCPGLKGANGQTPESAPGQLCVYVVGSPGGIVGFDSDTVTRFGFGLKAKFGTNDEENRVYGYWAVTAP